VLWYCQISVVMWSVCLVGCLHVITCNMSHTCMSIVVHSPLCSSHDSMYIVQQMDIINQNTSPTPCTGLFTLRRKRAFSQNFYLFDFYQFLHVFMVGLMTRLVPVALTVWCQMIGWLVDSELKGMWKEAVMAFEVLYQNFHGRTEGKHKKLWSG
jgi:hypothetical protein